ncbi:hypothetical protein ACF0H5_018498 [Mactra antiquata]
MKRMDTFLQENLNGYNLPADSLVELRSVLTRRYRKKFSQGLSPEGKQAMKDVAEQDGVSTGKIQKRPVSFKQSVKEQPGSRTRKISFTKTDTISAHRNNNSDGYNINGFLPGQKTKEQAVSERKEQAVSERKEQVVGEIVTNTESYEGEQVETHSDLRVVSDDNVKKIAVDKCMTWIQGQTEEI